MRRMTMGTTGPPTALTTSMEAIATAASSSAFANNTVDIDHNRDQTGHLGAG